MLSGTAQGLHVYGPAHEGGQSEEQEDKEHLEGHQAAEEADHGEGKNLALRLNDGENVEPVFLGAIPFGIQSVGTKETAESVSFTGVRGIMDFDLGAELRSFGAHRFVKLGGVSVYGEHIRGWLMLRIDYANHALHAARN